jgi:hypothetical protein
MVEETADLQSFIAYLKEEDIKNTSETADTLEIKPD